MVFTFNICFSQFLIPVGLCEQLFNYFRTCFQESIWDQHEQNNYMDQIIQNVELSEIQAFCYYFAKFIKMIFYV